MRVEIINVNNTEVNEIGVVRKQYDCYVGKDSLIFFTFSDTDISNIDLCAMVSIIKRSEYHVFVVPGDTDKIEDYSITYDIRDAEYVLLNPFIPKLAFDFEIAGIKSIDDLQELAERIITCGYSCVEANHLKCSIHKNSISSVTESNGRILYYAQHLPPYKNGGGIHILGFLEGIVTVLGKKYTIDVCTSKRLGEKYSIEKKYGVKCYEQEEIDDIYELCIVTGHIFRPDICEFVVRHSEKWINWILDAIDLRGYRGVLLRKYAKPMFEMVDGLIFSSRDACSDVESLMSRMSAVEDIRKEIVSIPARRAEEIGGVGEEKYSIPFEDFILVFGNGYPHKLISMTIKNIIETDENYIIVGCDEEGFIASNVFGYVSGNLSEELINLLYDRCEMLLFPSIYEGFGLPIVDALNYGKDVVLVDRPLNYEIEDLCADFKGHLHYYRSYDELPQMYREVREGEPIHKKNLYDRTWTDVASDLEGFIVEIYNKPKDDMRGELIEKYFAMADGGTQKYKTLLNIVRTGFSDIDCPFVIDIYGKAGAGMVFYNMIKDFCNVGCFVDVAAKNNHDDNLVGIVRPANYRYEDNHILVVIPEWDIRNIKRIFEQKDARFSENIISVTDFIYRYS